MQIVIATGNPHKVEEIRAIFSRLAPGVELLGLGDLGGTFEEPHEHGATFEANAGIKALGYAAQTGRWCLADDSGLEVDALAGRPGVISSHYCTGGREEGMTRAQRDAANNALVLSQLSGVETARRGARFVCVMALAKPGEIIARSRGTFEGRIGEPPRVPAGANGFGYDPLFLVAPGFTRTGAELTSEEKNRASHRARAAEEMAREVRLLARP